jgi:hypothetical protein
MKQTVKSYIRHLGAWTLMMGAASFSTQQLLAGGPDDVDYSYSGQAIGIYLSNLPETASSPVIAAQAGPLDSSGGKDDDHADHVDFYDGAVTCDHADAHVDGTGDHSDSHAHVAHFHIQFTGSDGSINTVEADDVDAHATVHHKPGKEDDEMGPPDKGPGDDEMGPGEDGPHDEEMGPGDDGPKDNDAEGDEDSDVDAETHVHVHGLVVNGERIKIDDDERQVLNYPGFTLIVNDQSQSESDDEGQAVATGIRIVVSDSVYAEVGQAEADLVAEEASESDVVSGSGTFTAANGDTDTFSFSGGTNGSLIFGDQTAGVDVVSTGLTSVTQVNATTEQLVYNCLINGVAGTATVIAQDVGGMFGAGDTFSISLSTGFSASGTLSSGEIVLLN